MRVCADGGGQDIFSYNVEQARGDTHNMIPVVMHEQGLELQEAVDFVGYASSSPLPLPALPSYTNHPPASRSEMCKASIDRFVSSRAALPAWTPAVDAALARYADGLADWIVGSLHWSFVSERYFGADGAAVKAARVVRLKPVRAGA